MPRWRGGSSGIPSFKDLSPEVRWRDRGKGRQARELLAGVYNGFTEGFGTADLAEASAILQERGEEQGRPMTGTGLVGAPVKQARNRRVSRRKQGKRVVVPQVR